MRNRTELIKRYSVFLLGIMANALGVAFITRSLLGTGPTTCIPYVASLKFPLSFGTFNFIFNLLLLLMQVILLRKDFKIYQLLQIPVAFLFSALIDVAMALTAFVQPDVYLRALFYTLLGCVLRAFGVSCQVAADVVMLSTEAFVKAFSDVIKKDFSVVKLVSDFIMTGIAVGMSFLFFKELTAVREGTLITVALVGPISHFFTKRLGFTDFIFQNEGELVYETKFKLDKEKRLVITLTSEPGSGGRIIARILGVIFDIPVYDKELVDMIAEKGHLPSRFVRKHNEKLYSNAAEAFIMENYNFSDDEAENYRRLYEAQCLVIKELAETKDCIIIGHCANYVLKDFPNALHIFITADMEHRISYISEKYQISRRRAIERIEMQDADTDDYVRHFTGQNWKESSNYQLTIDSQLFGYEGTAEIIEKIIKRNYSETQNMKVKDLVSKYHLDIGRHNAEEKQEKEEIQEALKQL